MSFDKLNEIFGLQYTLQEQLGVWKKIGNDPKMKQQYINQQLLACHEEVTEIMRETAYKNPEFVPFGWKKGQEFNEENMRNEIVDLLHFVTNLAMISGMDANELYTRYCKKNGVNHERQENNY